MLNVDLIKRPVTYSTRDCVYEILRENIITLVLEPGQSISEKEISDQLSVSRTPVREAFVRLAQEELLEIFPQKGTFVSLIDLYHVEETRFIREHLERATVREACDNFSADALMKLETNFMRQKQCLEVNNYTEFFEFDEEFHYVITSSCGRQKIWSVIQQMNAHLNRIRMLSLAANYDWDQILSQHENILKGIKEGDPNLAEKVMKEHLRKLTFEQDELKNEMPDYFK